MITTLVLALLLSQDPKPAGKTVEDRLKELDEKIAVLEKKHKALADENVAMEKRIADTKVWREKYARDKAAVWIRTYDNVLQLSPQKSAELQETYYGWHKAELEKPGAGASNWTAREEALKAQLTPEQVTRLVRQIREERETQAKGTISMFWKMAKLPPEKAGPAEKIIMAKIKIEENVLLPEAHAQKFAATWTQTFAAVESSVPELSLSDEEAAALRKIIDQWKPKQR